jgi:hypothetical protein
MTAPKKKEEVVAVKPTDITSLADDEAVSLTLGERVFQLSRYGTYQMTMKEGSEGDKALVPVPIADGPIWIARVLEHTEGARNIELAWVERGSVVRCKQFRRGELMNGPALAKLADDGVPVTGSSANKVASYLSLFQAQLHDRIPHAVVTNHMGWQDDDAFLWGAETFCANGDVQGLEPSALDGDAVNLIKACSVEGDAAGWARAVKKIQRHPVAVAALVTSLASPLLKVLGREGFIGDISGKSSTGKTIALEMAASVWGQPNPKNKQSITNTHNSTTVGIELMAERRGALPMIVDDTMTIRKASELEKLIYQQTAGRGRTRGAGGGGLRHEPVWLSTMVSTGERALSSYSQAGGAQARVLSFHEPPFGPRSEDEDSKEFVNELRRLVRENYGCAGPELVRYVLENRDEWLAWRKRCVKLETQLASEHEGQGTVDRQADFYATLFLTGEIAYAAGVLPFDPTEALEAAWKKVTDEASDMDKSRAAWLDVISWIDGHPDRFRDRKPGELVDRREPPGGWAGYKTDTYYGFAPPLLQIVLEQAGYGYEATLRAWREEGFIDAEPKRLTKKLSVGTGKVRLVLIKLEAIEEHGGD